MTKLHKPLYATGIHGITGSTNEGKSWYDQRADGREFRAAAPDVPIEVLEI